MGTLDRSLTASFGAVVLALMALFLSVASVLSFQIQDRRQNFLAAALAHSVGESVNRVNSYQMRGLVRELTDRVPGLGYIAVSDLNDTILAHSQPQWEGVTLTQAGMRHGDQADEVWQNVHYLQVSLPLLGGLNQGIVGTILVGISLEDLRLDQGRFLSALIALSLVGTLAAMGAVLLLSRRFGGQVQILARQLQGILEKAPVGVAILDSTGPLLQSSRSFAPLARGLGRFPEALSDRLSPADYRRLEEQTVLLRAQGRDAAGEWSLGSETWSLSQFPLENGQTGLIAQDLTQRVADEKELSESRLQLDQIIEKSPVGISVADVTTGKVLRVNECFYQTYGYGLEQVPDLDRWFEVAYRDPQVRKTLHSVWWRAVEQYRLSGTPIPPMETRLTCADGTVRDVVVSTALVGTLSVVTVVDRTSQKAAERALLELNRSLEEKVKERTEELELTYRELLDSEKLAALGQLAAGMAHELNTPLAAIQAANRYNLNFLHDSLIETLGQLSTLRPDESAFVLALADKNQRLASLPYHGPDRGRRKAVIAGLSTRGVEADDDLAEYLVELDFDDAALDKLAGNPTLLALVSRTRQLLELVRMTQIVSEGAEKASHVVEALRSYLKGGDEVEYTKFSVADQLGTILTLFDHKLKVAVEVTQDLDFRSLVVGDRQRLNQVWMNLVHNALQAMAFRGRLQLSVRRKGADVVVEVADSGPGIPESIRDRIFTPYFTTKKPGEGLGLGLDLCQKIVAAHNGTITFDSQPGATVFRVVLPAAPV
jgi:PAS domain S-box-containing protein